MASTNIYTLYRIAGRITCKSEGYHHGMPIYMVAAGSVKQACYLAHKEVWFFGGATGILEQTNGNDLVRDWKGNEKEDFHFRPGKVRRLTKADEERLKP